MLASKNHVVIRVNEHLFASDSAFVGDFAKSVGEGKLYLKSCSVNSALDS